MLELGYDGVERGLRIDECVANISSITKNNDHRQCPGHGNNKGLHFEFLNLI